MATISIEIADEVMAELEQVIARQAARAAAQFGGQIPPEIPLEAEAWITGILEQNISQMLADIIRTPEANEARAALQQAHRALVKAASGVRRVSISRHGNANQQG